MSGPSLSSLAIKLALVIAVLAVLVLQFDLHHLLPAQAIRTLCTVFFIQTCRRSVAESPRITGFGPLAPWHTATPRNGVEATLHAPPKCRVDQVRMLAREGRIGDFASDRPDLLDVLRKVRDLKLSEKGGLAMLNAWTSGWNGGRRGSGPESGLAQQTLEKHHGPDLRHRYEHLIASMQEVPSVFYAGDTPEERLRETAERFAVEFFRINDTKTTVLAPLTSPDMYLAPKDCAAFNLDVPSGGEPGQHKAALFRSTFLPSILARISGSHSSKSTLAMDQLSTEDVFAMHEICAYGMMSQTDSALCRIFTAEDWQQLEYYHDLYHYYNTGPGNRHGPAIGLTLMDGIVNAVKNPDAQSLAFYFVHAADIIAVVSALELLPQFEKLPVNQVLHDRVWKVSDILPIGSRMTFERLVCKPDDVCAPDNPMYPNHVFCESQPEEYYVRVNINDAIFPIPGCESGPGQSCRLDHFVRWLETRNKHMDFARKECFAEGHRPQKV